MNGYDDNPEAPLPPSDPERITALATTHPEQLLVMHLSLIDDVVGLVARRNRLCSQDRDDFNSVVRLHLIEDDYRVLRRFRGESTLRTYLMVVITRLLLDYRIAQWGKWRPSAEAKRHGPLAVRLETLVCRDQMTIDAACEVLARSNTPCTPYTAAVMLNRLPVRTCRRFVGEHALADLPAPAPGPDAQIEMAPVRHRASQALVSAVRRLDPDDRRLLRLRFRDRVPVATIARQDGVDQKRLYRRIDRLVASIRPELEKRGVDAASLGLRAAS